MSYHHMLWHWIIIIFLCSLFGCSQPASFSTSGTINTFAEPPRSNYFSLFEDDNVYVGYKPDGILLSPSSEIRIFIVIKLKKEYPPLKDIKGIRLTISGFSKKESYTLFQDVDPSFVQINHVNNSTSIVTLRSLFNSGSNTQNPLAIGNHNIEIQLQSEDPIAINASDNYKVTVALLRK